MQGSYMHSIATLATKCTSKLPAMRCSQRAWSGRGDRRSPQPQTPSSVRLPPASHPPVAAAIQCCDCAVQVGPAVTEHAPPDQEGSGRAAGHRTRGPFMRTREPYMRPATKQQLRRSGHGGSPHTAVPCGRPGSGGAGAGAAMAAAAHPARSLRQASRSKVAVTKPSFCSASGSMPPLACLPCAPACGTGSKEVGASVTRLSRQAGHAWYGQGRERASCGLEAPSQAAPAPQFPLRGPQ